MSKFVLLAILLLFSIVSFSQEKALRYIKKGKYDKAYKYIKKELVDEPNDIVLNYALTKLFCIVDYRKNNTDSAYFYIKKTEKYFFNLDDKTKKKLVDVICYDSIKNKKNEICITAFNKTKQIHTIESCEAFIRYYEDSGYLINEAIKLRNSIAFDQAIKENTVQSFQYFINKYPNSLEKNVAISKRNELAYKSVTENNTIEAYQTFIDSYPEAIEINTVINARNSLAFKIASEKNSIESYDYFLSKFPNADEVRKAISNRDQLAFKAADSINTVESYHEFIIKYSNSDLFDKAKQRYEILFFVANVISGNVNSYISFISNNQQLKHALKLAEDSLFYYSKVNLNIKGMKYFIDNCEFCKKSDSLNIEFFNVFTGNTLPFMVKNIR